MDSKSLSILVIDENRIRAAVIEAGLREARVQLPVVDRRGHRDVVAGRVDVGWAPYNAQIRRSRRSTWETWAPNTPR